MPKLKKESIRLFQTLNETFGDFRKRVKNTTGWGLSDPIIVQPYWGYGCDNYLHMRGRVLEDENIVTTDDDGKWRNLWNAYKRFESDEIADAKVTVNFLGKTFSARTDSEGYFVIDEHFEDATETITPPLTRAETHLVDVPGNRNVHLIANSCVLTPAEDAEFGIISDVDDTVLQTHVTSPLKWRMFVSTFFENANSRMSFAGTPELYRALAAGSDGQQQNPVFYVSNSPWNLFDFLLQFLKTNKLPLGPVILRDLGLPKGPKPEGWKGHKHGNITKILNTYPHLPFVLIGDSGERDADIYREIALEHPDRIKAIYIRDLNVRKHTERIQALFAEEAPTPMILANDAEIIAQHAQGLKLVGKVDWEAV